MMVMLPRYLVFAGKFNEQTGGWHNFKGEFHTEPEAQAFVDALPLEAADWWHIVDLCNRVTVAGGMA